MSYAIIGSGAIKFWYPDFREPKDLDIVTENKIKPSIQTSLPIELLENPIIINNLTKWTTKQHLHPDMLYLLKISHCFWDINWEKHIQDLKFLKDKGNNLTESSLPILQELFEYWNCKHPRKASNLDMSAEDFFNNNIECPVEHDQLHEMLIKHQEFQNQKQPTYTRILKDGEEVAVDEQKFNKLTHQEKLNLVFEEVAVMAFERYSNLFFIEGYHKMLKKFILFHCPVWEGYFILDNIYEVYHYIPFNYKRHLNQYVKSKK